MSKDFFYQEDQHGNPTLFWINPWNGEAEPLAHFFWPTHDPAKTRLIEEFYELMGRRCADAARLAWQEINKMEEAN